MNSLPIMEQNSLEIKIGKIAGLSTVFSFLMFWIIAYIWPKAPGFLAYTLIFIFIGGIVLFFARKLIWEFASRLMRNKKLLITLLIVLLSLFSFYWFELRPNWIRKKCEWLIFSEEKASYRGTVAVRQNNKYRLCLISNGLKPESLFVNTE